ncbi:MAG: EamA family transporter [Clostridiales bacterium]|nr:EamA family transporter [Clostridiales bacterium]
MVREQAGGQGRERYRVPLALAAVYLFWGGTYLGMKYAIQTIPPFLMAGLRFCVAGWILYAVLRLKGEKRPTGAQLKNAGIVGALLLVGGNGIVAMAEQTVPSSIASLLVATVPLWITLIQFITERKKPSVGTAVGIVLGLCGIAALVWNPGAASQTVNLLGILALLLATLSWSAGSLYSAKANMPHSPLLSTSVQMIVGGTLLLILAAFHGDFQGFSFAQVSGSSWLAMGYLILFGSLTGFTAFVWLLKNAEPSVVATYAYVNPVVAILLGWLIAGERHGVNALIAAAVIIVSVVLITRYRDRT